MKNVKFLLSGLLVMLATAAVAQDLSDPRYAKWGAVEARRENMLANDFLKEGTQKKILLRNYQAGS